MSDFFASVSWNVEDVKRLKPDWSDEQCASFLSSEENTIQEMMIERGWQAIESLLADWKEEEGVEEEGNK